MKKVLLFLLFLTFLVQAAFAQVDWGNYSHSFPGGATDNPATVAVISAIPKPNDSYWNTANSPNLDKLVKDLVGEGVSPATIIARMTFDTARVHFFLHGVNPKNAGEYQFRVREYPANTVLVPWQSIRRFTEPALIKQSGLPQMAYLGGYTAPLSHMVSVEVRQTGSKQLVGASVIAWVSIRPAITGLYTSENLDAFFKKLQYPWARQNNSTKVSGRVDQPHNPLMLASTNTNLILVLNAEIYSKRQVQYELIRNGEVIISWKDNDYDNSFVWLKEYKPGSYQLNIRYTVQPQHVASYYFDVEPTWYQSTGFRIMVGIFIAACLGAALFLVLFIQQKQKSRRELANKTKLQLELKAIYAQLNPHFVFNALSSIQGLINKQDIEGANNYLADFARLMRESLTNSHKDEVSLNEEIRVMDTYLKLEQLRFGFQYEIILDERVNRFDTSIPVLLLQPLVENAVKHGVSTLQEAGAGCITIRFDKTGETMAVHIIDNGRGFLANNPSDGFGLKLTRDRIKLLNELNKGQPIHFEVTPNIPTGAEMKVLFTNWFV